MNYGNEWDGIRGDAERDRKDCTVIAVSVACGIPYAEASAAMASAGRRKNTGTQPDVYANVIRNLGFHIRRINLRSKTVRTAERELAKNYGGVVVMIHVRAHVLVWNGREIVDWSKDRHHRIEWADLVWPVGAEPKLGRSVPMAPQKAAKKTSRPTSAMEARIADQPFVKYPSIKAAYEANGVNLRGHQKIRKSVKHWGQARFYVCSSKWNGMVMFEIRLADMSAKTNKAPGFDPVTF